MITSIQAFLVPFPSSTQKPSHWRNRIGFHFFSPKDLAQIAAARVADRRASSPVGALALLYTGRQTSAKSFQALEWALSIALGTETNGHKTKMGTVVYIYAEGGAPGLQREV